MTLTPEQLAEIDKRMADTIKAALTGADFKAVLSAALTPAIEGATKPLAEKLATLEAGAKKPETAPEKKGEDGKVPAEVQAQINALKAELTASQEKAKAAERAAMEDRAYGSVREALAKAGVPADRVPLAMAFVKTEGLVKFAEDGTFGFEKIDQWGGKIKQDPAAWAGEFIRTDTGKALLPAAPTAGTGDRPPNTAPVTSTGAVDWAALSRGPINLHV